MDVVLNFEGRRVILLKWLASAVLAFFMYCCLSGPAQAQTVNRYTNSTDSTVGQISGAVACTVGVTFQRDIFVADDFSVQDVNLGILLAHNTRSEFGVFLRSPAGNIVTAKTTVGGNLDNFSVLLDDQAAANVSSHNVSNDTATASTIVPPYQRTYRPSASFNATFVGQSSYGTWSIFICDFNNNAVNGTFYQADLYLTTPPPSADLSLSKTVASGTPSSAVYTLTVTNSTGSVQTASGVTVRDILPAGVSYVSSSGTGTYNNVTGIWTPGTSIAPGASYSIDITVNVTAASGTTITNTAQIMTSSQTDPDSTPGNGVTSEDDYATRSFTVGGRMPGLPASIAGICSTAGTTTTVLDWNVNSWTSGSTTGSANVAGLGTVNFSVSTQGIFSAPLALTTDNTGGFGSGGLSLFQSIDYSNNAQSTTTTVTLPASVAGAQFRIFDVDFATADFADKLTITGSNGGGAPFNATLTNGASNYISGNSAIGDGGSNGPSDDGNVVATFSAPVDTITIVYGNHTTAPADPDGQAISIHDFTFCRPIVDLNVTKMSTVLSDGVSGSNPKAIPGATIRYCILVSNAGGMTTNSVVATDTLPADISYSAGTMLSGTNCSNATTAEDDDNSDSGETDPVRMSISGTTITGTAATLTPGQGFAMVFNATID